MSEISEKTRDQIWQILHKHKKEDEWATVVFDILSIDTLAVVDREAELPNKVMVKFKCKPELTMAAQSELGDTAIMAYQQAQDDMLNAHYIKEIR